MSFPQGSGILGNTLTYPRTYNAVWFGGVTNEAKITAAITAAVTDGMNYVYVPGSMLPYNPALVTFNSAILMICEGGVGGADVRAYGAAGNGTTDDAPSFSAAIQSGFKVVNIPPLAPGKFFRLSTPVNCTNQVGVTLNFQSGHRQSQEQVQFAHNGIGFDFTGSSMFEINSPTLNVVNGFAPSCFMFFARNQLGALNNAGLHRIHNPWFSGPMVNGFIYNYASEEFHCDEGLMYTTSISPLIIITGRNIRGLVSPFLGAGGTATGAQSNTVHRFAGGSYYAAGASAANKLFLIESVADVDIRGSFWYVNGGLCYVHNQMTVAGSNADFVNISNLRCEPGTAPQYGIFFDSPTNANIPVYWTLRDSRITASTTMVYASDLAEIQHFAYSHISDQNVTGMSVKNGSYLYYDGFTFAGRAGGVVDRSVFIGPASTYTFTGSLGIRNVFIDSDTGNVINVYGTFTPTLTLGGTAIGSATTIANYNRVGNKVFFNINITVVTVGAGVGTVAIGGLPASVAGENYPILAKIDGSNLAAGFYSGYITGGTGSINLQISTYGAPTVNTNMANTNVNVGTSFMISGVYKV